MDNGRYAAVEVTADKVANTMTHIVNVLKGFVRSIVPNIKSGQGNSIATTYMILYWTNP